jgi:hypothetical protein
VAHTAGDAARARPPAAVPAPWTQRRRTAPRGSNHERYRSRTAHATDQKRNVRADKKIGVNLEQQWKWTVEMTVYGKPGKR